MFFSEILHHVQMDIAIIYFFSVELYVTTFFLLSRR